MRGEKCSNPFFSKFSRTTPHHFWRERCPIPLQQHIANRKKVNLTIFFFDRSKIFANFQLWGLPEYPDRDGSVRKLPEIGKTRFDRVPIRPIGPRARGKIRVFEKRPLLALSISAPGPGGRRRTTAYFFPMRGSVAA